MRRVRAALAFALVTTGCGAPSWQAAAELAADRWHVACGLRPEPQSVTVLDTKRVPCGDVTNAAGCTTRRGHGPDVTVARYASVPAEDLLLHEFGHVLGAGHHAGVGTMVYGLGSDRWRPCLTADDLAEVGCPTPRPECYGD